jgi:hypothetical protein
MSSPTYFREVPVYHRKTYFADKLNLIAGMKQCQLIDYNETVDLLKDYHFDDIFELRDLMKELKLSKFYRFIYSIYYDIKNVKVINLTHTDISFLLHKFLELERLYKGQRVSRKNIISHDIIIYCMFRKYGLAYDNIILPKNAHKNIDFITELLNNI